MELVQITIPAVAEVIRYAGIGEFTVGSKEKLKIKAHSEDILNATVPDDKMWTVRIELHIDETDEE